MRNRSPLDYDVSVSADKARRARQRGHTGRVEGAARRCEHPGCDKAAEYRAPAAPDNLGAFRWFCLDHVREYNRRWNYFNNWSAEEIEAQRRADVSWDRPTWRIGQRAQRPEWGSGDGQSWARSGFADPLEVLGDRATINPGQANDAAKVRRRLLPKNERSAVEILGVDPDAPKSEIRTRFRALVKDLHPDMNGGARQDEDRLRDVVWAWEQIKGSRSFRD